MDLVEFLLAQIAEDEAVAQAAVGTAAFQQQTGRWVFEHVRAKHGPMPIVFALADGGGKTQAANLELAWERDERGAHIARHDPARVLAECAAKRRIVDAYLEESRGRHDLPARTPVAGALMWVLKCLALPYADHPDWRDEWRPSA